MQKVLAILIGLVVFAACKKYEDGPVFSLRTREERVANTWVYDKIYRNGEDVTNQTIYNIAYQARYHFNKDGDAAISFVGIETFAPLTGRWGFKDNDEKIFIFFDGIESTTQWEILRLKENELWYRLTGKDPMFSGNGTDVYEGHLTPE